MVSITLKVTLPERPFAKKKWLQAIASAQRKTSIPKLKKLFRSSVFGWSRKPDFGWTQTRGSNRVAIYMYPSGPNAETWKLVSAGSPAHRIPLSGGTFMSYRPGYRAATRPGQLMGRRAYRSGKPRGAMFINHKGFEARNFPELIAEEFRPQFTDDMQNAINIVARS